jgi:hypothetical protein
MTLEVLPGDLDGEAPPVGTIVQAEALRSGLAGEGGGFVPPFRDQGRKRAWRS